MASTRSRCPHGTGQVSDLPTSVSCLYTLQPLYPCWQESQDLANLGGLRSLGWGPKRDKVGNNKKARAVH